MDLITLLKVVGFLSQPDRPAELGNKSYEMMAMAVGGRWGRAEEGEAWAGEDSTESDASSSEASEAQVVEPSEVRTESDPWE